MIIEFDFIESIRYWCSEKKRHIKQFKSILKETIKKYKRLRW